MLILILSSTAYIHGKPEVAAQESIITGIPHEISAQESLDKKKVVLHLLIWPIHGGVESNLANLMRSYKGSSIENVIAFVSGAPHGASDKYYPGFDMLKKRVAHVPDVSFNSRGDFSKSNYWKSQQFLGIVDDLEKLVDSVKPDVVHVPFHLDFLFAFALHLRTGVPIVPVLHNAQLNYLSPLQKKLFPTMLAEYQHYQVGNFAGNRLLSRNTAIFSKHENISFKSIPNCVDHTVYKFNSESRKSIRTQYGIKDDEFLIGCVGGLFELKRPLWVIHALEHILAHDPQKKIKVMLVGSGDLRQTLENYIKEKGIENNVILTGLQQNSAPFYSAFDLYVHPSSLEACGLAMLEALATGLPVVMYSAQPKGTVDRIYGFFQDGYNVHAVYENTPEDFAIAVEKMVNDNNYRLKFSSVARASIQEFSPENVADLFYKILLEAALHPKAPQPERYAAFEKVIKELCQ